MRVDHRSSTPHHVRAAAELPFHAKSGNAKVVVLTPDHVSSVASATAGSVEGAVSRAGRTYKSGPRVITMRLRSRREDDVEVWGPEAA